MVTAADALHTATGSCGIVTAKCELVDLGKPRLIATGICFLDHMIDQLTSHAQLGVGMRVSLDGVEVEPHQDYCVKVAPDTGRLHDVAIFEATGSALGQAIRLLASDLPSDLPSCSFHVPLDEALAHAVLALKPPLGKPSLDFSLAPYGTMPRTGRIWIGRFKTELTEVFWFNLVNALGASLSLRKIRGQNAHHIVESTFKSFARVLRASLDAPSGAPKPVTNGVGRAAQRERNTKETSIKTRINLDAVALGTSTIATGVPFLDRFLSEFRETSGFDLEVNCNGDRHIDEHHTAEDVSIAIGQCFHEALGDKKGLTRMGWAEGCSGDAKVLVVIDLSNRPHFECDLELDEEFVGGEAAVRAHDDGQSKSAALSCEMLFHVLLSLSIEMRSTVHVVQMTRGETPGFTGDLALATARAYGTALKTCATFDPRRGGVVASSKGTLSA